METRHYLTCLWPGLPELWWRGRLSAIPTAIAFGLALNVVLIARYLYPQWVASGLAAMAFWVGLVAWGFTVVRNVRELPALIVPRRASDQPDRFPEAHAAYLRGDWNEAEKLLTDVLAIEPRDPPALLLLTSVYRHSERLDSADVLLQEIRRLEVADRWWMEVDSEARRLQRDKRRAEENRSEDAKDSTQNEGAVDDRDGNPDNESAAADLTADDSLAA